jgi:hypothetical protein
MKYVEYSGPYYRLVDGKPTRCTWNEWLSTMGDADARTVALWQYSRLIVSTVFVGVDFSYGEDKRPRLWETRVTGGPLNDQFSRYPSLAEARRGHRNALARVRRAAARALPV